MEYRIIKNGKSSSMITAKERNLPLLLAMSLMKTPPRKQQPPEISKNLCVSFVS